MSVNEPLPFATATIAHLFLAQGKLERAEAVFRQLLEERPADPRLAEGLAEVLRRRQVSSRDAVGESRLELQRSGEELVCTWRVTEEGRRRARLVLGEAGRLVLRLQTFPLDEAVPPTCHPLSSLSGTLRLPLQGTTIEAPAGEGGGETSVSKASGEPSSETPGATGAPESEPSDAAGVPLGGASLLVGSVGLVAGEERFVSIAHCTEPLRLDR